MNKFRSAAIEILQREAKPLHYKEITRLAIEAGILETDGATPDATMNAQLATDVKHKGVYSDFIRTEAAIFALNPNKQEPPVKQKAKLEEKDTEEVKEEIESSFIGKAGEHLVCSELLFRGYNASIMSVDSGMDIIATKNNKLFSIQVKTAHLNNYNTYIFNVRKVSFEKDYSGSVFYVFVLRAEKHTRYIVIPIHEMEKKVHEKAILELKTRGLYRVSFRESEGKIYLGSKEHEIGYYLNNWSVIK